MCSHKHLVVKIMGEVIEQFAASMNLVLDLTDKYPRDSLAAHILDVIAQFLPVLIMSWSRRGRVAGMVSVNNGVCAV